MYIVIIMTILRYGLLALAGAVFLAALYAGEYLICKKIFHGTKTLSIRQWVTLVLLSGWLLLVLGLTTFSRGANFTGSINISLFSGYINAWHKWSYTELQWRPLMKMLVLPLIYIIGVGSAVIVYQNQEYGNMPIIPAEKQNMSIVSVKNEAELSNQTDKVGVYKNLRVSDTQYSGTIEKAIEELTGTKFKSTAHQRKVLNLAIL